MINHTTFSSSGAESLDSWLEELNEFKLERLIPFRTMGKGYALIGQIDIVKRDADSIVANISGTRTYKIALYKKATKIISQCDCPYESFCKHQAALLLLLIK